MQFICNKIQAGNQFFLSQFGPIAELIQDFQWHEYSCREIIGKLFHAIPGSAFRLLYMFGWHGFPSKNVEKFVGKIKMAPTRNLASCNQYCIQIREVTSGTRDTVNCIDHQHQNIQFFFHHSGQL